MGTRVLCGAGASSEREVAATGPNSECRDRHMAAPTCLHPVTKIREINSLMRMIG